MARPAPVARTTYAEHLAAEAESDVLVEVRSEATEAYDRGAKWAHCRPASLGVRLEVASIYANPLGQ